MGTGNRIFERVFGGRSKVPVGVPFTALAGPLDASFVHEGLQSRGPKFGPHLGPILQVARRASGVRLDEGENLGLRRRPLFDGDFEAEARTPVFAEQEPGSGNLGPVALDRFDVPFPAIAAHDKDIIDSTREPGRAEHAIGVLLAHKAFAQVMDRKNAWPQVSGERHQPFELGRHFGGDFHRHRGTWRRRQVTKEEALRALIAAKEPGCEGQKLRRLHSALDSYPDLWRAGGDLSDRVRKSILRLFDQDTTQQVSIQRGIEHLRRELGFEDAMALERLLIKQVVTAHLQASTLALQLEGASQVPLDGPRILSLERRYHQAHGRLLRSIETLARIRKHVLPRVQVSIAEQQIHFGS